MFTLSFAYIYRDLCLRISTVFGLRAISETENACTTVYSQNYSKVSEEVGEGRNETESEYIIQFHYSPFKENRHKNLWI